MDQNARQGAKWDEGSRGHTWALACEELRPYGQQVSHFLQNGLHLDKRVLVAVLLIHSLLLLCTRPSSQTSFAYATKMCSHGSCHNHHRCCPRCRSHRCRCHESRPSCNVVVVEKPYCPPCYPRYQYSQCCKFPQYPKCSPQYPK